VLPKFLHNIKVIFYVIINHNNTSPHPMSHRHKIVLFIGGIVALAVFFFAMGEITFLISNANKKSAPGAPFSPTQSSDNQILGNAFVRQNSSAPVGAPLSGAEQSPVVFGGPGVASPESLLKEVKISSSNGSASVNSSGTSNLSGGQGAPAVAVGTLPLKNVSDSEISIDPSGISTVADYIRYVDVNYADVSFDNTRFSSVLKDKNGIIIFSPQLVAQALADGNFSEIHNSLLVDKDYAAAKIKFFKSVKVTGSAISIDKEMIGFEYLTNDLIDHALAVGSGAFSKGTLSQFYGQFMATAREANGSLFQQLNNLSVKTDTNENFFTRIMQMLGLYHPALAQTPVNMPLGGPITTIVPCTCPASLGYWVTIGPPRPASLFVSMVFVSSPLFFLDKSLVPGVWWLGSYTSVPMTCSQVAPPPAPGCVPIGAGSIVYMAGTSLAP
jgi:hypothetical protein